jgi:putative pyruvate formate lyase activating enzyme
MVTGIPAEIGQCSTAVQKLWSMMNPCILCMRNCRVNRLACLAEDVESRRDGELGYCGIGAEPLISSVGPHFGEESVLVGSGGSGTIFFSGCNLGCVFCQNYEISHHKGGCSVSISDLVKTMLSLQKMGCVNINLVTPSHVSAACAAAIELARKEGLKLPVVYNCGGYDSVETLRLLEGLIDIYMPDLKYAESSVSLELSGAGNYPRVSREAVTEMHRQVGDLQIQNGLARRGLLVRHLVLPNDQAGSFDIIDFITEHISIDTAINIMDQYRPCYKAGEHTLINRRPTREEIDTVRKYAADKGLRLIS